MSDEPQKASQDSLKDEFRRLGSNLQQTIINAWESDERKEVQKDLEEGFTELISSLRKMASEFEQSPAAQQMKSDIHDINERVQSGELQSKVRQDIFGALRKANEEIEKTFQTNKTE